VAGIICQALPLLKLAGGGSETCLVPAVHPDVARVEVGRTGLIILARRAACLPAVLQVGSDNYAALL